MTADFDVVIAGGGLAGASLALALRGQPLRVAVIEAVPWSSPAQPSYDDRVLALSYGTRRIFEALGLWAAIAPEATPIRRIHISDRGHFGITRLDSRDHGLEALGYVVEARRLGAVLGEALQRADNTTLICPATVRAVDIAPEGVSIQTTGQPATVRARLLVAADGGHSTVRELLNIASFERDYGQTAVIANVTPTLPHDNVAYERFTDTGPLALLPMREQRCSLVWTVRHEQVGELMALDDAQFLQRLQERFGHRLGQFLRVGRRHDYPLRLLRAREQVRPRLALIGNAAHTLHPVAGQGFNLGLRDAAALAQVIADAAREHHDIGTLAVLQDYARWRRADQRRTIGFTDRLVDLFSTDLRQLALARNIGLSALDLLPPLKRILGRYAMGTAGRQPRLARGLPL